ncbi:MAG: hypothetical protein PF961_18455 [Planctomycetota bacterium]|jgi:hypothetical protein|nr:hypothetical protein [Planctomycetota bacterium]
MDPREIYGGPDAVQPKHSPAPRLRLVLPPWCRWSLSCFLAALCLSQVVTILLGLIPGAPDLSAVKGAMSSFVMIPLCAASLITGLGAISRESFYAALWTFPAGYFFFLHLYLAATAAAS